MKRAARSWEAFGGEDPLGAILTRSAEAGGGWEVDEFFATGRHDAELALARVARWREPATIHRALDFGCGVGRVTRALAERIDEVQGVDVAASMVERARAFDHERRCRFHQNVRPDLRLFGDASFDLVHSVLTLQHLPPRVARGYVAEFGRVLAPGGIAVFQLPTGPRRGRWLGDKPLLRHLGPLLTACARAVTIAWRHRVLRRPVMEMAGLPEEVVVRTLVAAGCEVLSCDDDDSAGPDWISRVYVARKGSASAVARR